MATQAENMKLHMNENKNKNKNKNKNTVGQGQERGILDSKLCSLRDEIEGLEDEISNKHDEKAAEKEFLYKFGTGGLVDEISTKHHQMKAAIQAEKEFEKEFLCKSDTRKSVKTSTMVKVESIGKNLYSALREAEVNSSRKVHTARVRPRSYSASLEDNLNSAREAEQAFTTSRPARSRSYSASLEDNLNSAREAEQAFTTSRPTTRSRSYTTGMTNSSASSLQIQFDKDIQDIQDTFAGCDTVDCTYSSTNSTYNRHELNLLGTETISTMLENGSIGTTITTPYTQVPSNTSTVTTASETTCTTCTTVHTHCIHTHCTHIDNIDKDKDIRERERERERERRETVTLFRSMYSMCNDVTDRMFLVG